MPRVWREHLAKDPSPAMLRQVLPSRDELTERCHFTIDPLKEQAPTTHKDSDFLLQKYSGRALLMTTTRCFGNCRFCFRRHLRQLEKDAAEQTDYSHEIAQLADDPHLREIILSGGDPLTLPDPKLEKLLFGLAEIPHLRRVRIHTRAVSFCPERITEPLCEMLRKLSTHYGKACYAVLHVNHADELGPEARDAIRKLLAAGVTLLHQGVLLRGVNDDVEILRNLLETLVDLRVLPYYLHQLDRVAGAAHFEVPVEEGDRLMDELRKTLSGYAVPRYVREIPGETSKTPV
ncbi:MAG: KamA family radical SAM protein [Planctomycetia bacterium]|nr:KamA family radical SAM protein [Planctomycetia bacterium]